MAHIRAMNRTEVQELVRWADAEGWNPGLHDADFFWQADPAGFLAAEEDGVLAGGGAIVRHSGQFGFMGLFIVEASRRGRGLGTELWFARRDLLLDRLADGGVIGMDGVDAMVPFYEKGGFTQFTRHRRFQIEGVLGHLERSTNVVDVAAVDVVELADFDARHFPARRETYLREWAGQKGAVSLAFLEGEKIVGFSVMRPCQLGWKIGPLFAETPAIAEALLQASLRENAGDPVFLDAPDNNPDAIALCAKYNMTEVFGCERMYHGPPPALEHAGIYGVTTLEIG